MFRETAFLLKDTAYSPQLRNQTLGRRQRLGLGANWFRYRIFFREVTLGFVLGTKPLVEDATRTDVDSFGLGVPSISLLCNVSSTMRS